MCGTNQDLLFLASSSYFILDLEDNFLLEINSEKLILHSLEKFKFSWGLEDFQDEVKESFSN